MNELITETQLRPIGIVVAPDDLRKVRVAQEQDLNQDKEQVLAEINAFLLSLNLDLPFKETEILTDAETGMILLQSPATTTALSYEDSGEQRLVHVSANEQLRELQIAGLNLHEKEAKPLEQSINLGNGLFMLNFAVKFSLPKLGVEAKDGLFSTIMRSKSNKQEPLIVLGKKEEMLANQQEPEVKNNQELRLSSEVYEKINTLISSAEQLFNGKFPRPSEKLVNDEENNVNDVEFWCQNGNFFGVLILHMNNGGQKSFVFNKGKEVNGELLQASSFVVSSKIDGQPAVAIVKQKRLNGNFSDKGEETVELPRGFDNSFFAKGKKFLIEEEAGLGASYIEKNITDQLVLREDRQIGTTVNGRLIFVDLPEDTNFSLENKRELEPAAKAEELVPSWMKLTDILDLIKSGEAFVDAHSLAMIATWVAKNQLLVLKDGLEQAAIYFSKYQDIIDGEVHLSLPRAEQQKYLFTLNGAVTPNSGATRIKQRTLLSVANAADQEFNSTHEVLDLPTVWQKIANSEFDNTTTASIFKFLVQYGYLNQKPA